MSVLDRVRETAGRWFGRSNSDPLLSGEDGTDEPEYVELTSVIDGRAHRVLNEEVASLRARHFGHYLAVCTHLVVPAPLADPEGQRCDLCFPSLAAGRPHPAPKRVGR